MIYKDMYCKKCDVEYIDVPCEHDKSKFTCPDCGNSLEIIFNKMSFKLVGPGFHKTDYPCGENNYKPDENRHIHHRRQKRIYNEEE